MDASAVASKQKRAQSKRKAQIVSSRTVSFSFAFPLKAAAPAKENGEDLRPDLLGRFDGQSLVYIVCGCRVDRVDCHYFSDSIVKQST